MPKPTSVTVAGKLGGLKRAANLTKEQRAEAARKAAHARWARREHVFEPDVEHNHGLYCIICGASETGHRL